MLEQIINIAETDLFYQRMPSRIYISEEEKTMPGLKASKNSYSFAWRKFIWDLQIKITLVHRSENPIALKGISKATLPVHYFANPKAWITLIIFEQWFMFCFIQRSFVMIKEFLSRFYLFRIML